MSPASQSLTLENSSEEVVKTKLGTFSKGSVLSYQQIQDPVNIINVNNIDFPDLPLNNYMLPLSGSMWLSGSAATQRRMTLPR